MRAKALFESLHFLLFHSVMKKKNTFSVANKTFSFTILSSKKLTLKASYKKHPKEESPLHRLGITPTINL